MAKKKKKTLASTRKSSKAAKEESKQQETAEEVLKDFEKKAQEKVEKAQKKKQKKEKKPKLPKAPKEPKPPKVKMAPEKKQKIRGGILAAIGLFALIFMGWFLFGKMFRPSFLAEMLPAGKTIAIVEINIDPATGQPQQFFETLKSAPLYKQETVSLALKSLFPLPLRNEELWLGRRAGVAMYALQAEDGTSTIAPVFFVESRDHQKTLDTLHQLQLKTINGEIVFSEVNGVKVYEQAEGGAAFMFLDNYLVASAEGRDILMDIAASRAAPPLSNNPDYRKVANNLPQGGILFAYVSTRDLFSTLTNNQVFTAQKGQDFRAFQPFLELFPAEGITVMAENQKFTAQMFTVIDKEKLDGQGFLRFNEKYHGDLLNWANENLVLVAGGHDLTKEITRLEEVFKSGAQSSSLIFDGMMEAQKQKYFGKDISLTEDVWPLLTEEYLITVENSFEEPVVTAILQLPNGDANRPELEKLVNSFVQVSGVFTPTIQTVTLPDGTTGQEVVASPEEIEKSVIQHGGIEVDVLTIGNTGLSIYVAVVNGKAVFSTAQDSLERIINRQTGRGGSQGFTATKYYQSGLQPLLRNSDEVVHLKVGALIEALQLEEIEESNVHEYLLPFTNFTFGRNYFDDGISTITVVDVLP